MPSRGPSTVVAVNPTWKNDTPYFPPKNYAPAIWSKYLA